MIDLPDTTTVASALSIAQKAVTLIKSIASCTDDTDRQEALMELREVVSSLQERLVKAQTDQLQLLEIVGDLKAQILEHSSWEEEAAHYHLSPIVTGIEIWTLKDPAERTERPMHICPRCYEDRKRSPVQRHSLNHSRLECVTCDFLIVPTATSSVRVLR